MDYDRLSAADTAKLVRAALKRAFPDAKFSVRSDRNSINVRWTDGPSRRAVEAVADAYRGGGFDGMIDMAYDISSWLLPDGSAALAYSPGTQGSMGTVPKVGMTPRPHPDARLVRFGARYVFCTRSVSPALEARIAGFASRHVPSGDTDFQRDRAMCFLRATAQVVAGSLVVPKDASVWA
jgi:Large polyvalent protein associated domain 29